jgi:hypothetical protein
MCRTLKVGRRDSRACAKAVEDEMAGHATRASRLHDFFDKSPSFANAVDGMASPGANPRGDCRAPGCVGEGRGRLKGRSGRFA